VSAQPWLEPGDRFLLDERDHIVVEALIVRANRGSLRVLTTAPELGGERRMLLQTEDDLLEAAPVDAEAFDETEGALDGRSFTLQWQDDARIERAAVDARTRFGRGECRWYAAEDDAVAVVIEDRQQREAVVGEPLAAARIDLRFT